MVYLLQLANIDAFLTKCRCRLPGSTSSDHEEAATHLWGNCSEEVEQKPVYIWFLARKYIQQSILLGMRLLLNTKNEYFSSVQSLSHVWLCVTPRTAACQASLSITNSRSLLKLMSIESVMPSNHLILCCPLLLQPSIFLIIRVFSNESVLRNRWPKYWSFQLQHQFFQWIFRTDLFRMHWLDVLAVQGTLKSLLQHHSSKASILRCSAFFISLVVLVFFCVWEDAESGVIEILPR